MQFTFVQNKPLDASLLAYISCQNRMVILRKRRNHDVRMGLYAFSGGSNRHVELSNSTRLQAKFMFSAGPIIDAPKATT